MSNFSVGLKPCTYHGDVSEGSYGTQSRVSDDDFAQCYWIGRTFEKMLDNVRLCESSDSQYIVSLGRAGDVCGTHDHRPSIALTHEVEGASSEDREHFDQVREEPNL